MKRRSFIRVGGATLAGTVCRQAQATSTVSQGELILPEGTEVRTGGSRMIDIGGGHHVWTKKVGDGAIKVLLLHGGPGGDHEKAADYQAPEYQKVMFEQVYTRHLCRLNPWPEPITRGFRHLNEKIYNYFQGPNEFMVTGTMKGWERWDDLPRIRTKTLVLGAKYDEMAPQDLRKMAESIPNARAWISETGSHLAMYDDQIPYFTALLTFLKSA